MAVTPTEERHWFSIPAPEHDDTPQVAPQTFQLGLAAWAVGCPPSTSGTRFWRTATTSGVIVTSVPHAPTFTEPSAWITSEAAPLTRGSMVFPSVT